MNKNKLIFSLFVAINASFSGDKQTQEKKEINKKESYYELANKVAFLKDFTNNKEKYDIKLDEIEKKKKQINEELTNNQKKTEEKYSLISADVLETSEDLKKKLDQAYANLTLTDKAYVAFNNHWPKAAIFSGIFVAAVLVYKYFSADQDDANDTEDEE